MITFYLAAAALLLLAFALLLPAFFRRKAEAADDQRNAQNIAIAREQLAELKQQHAEGELNDSAYEQARENLESQLATDLAAEEAQSASAGRGQWAGIAVAVSTPLLAGFLYLTLGSPGAIDAANAPQPDPHASQQQEMPSIEEMVTKLEERMQQTPEDPQGWFMLARTYMVQNRFIDAVGALRKVQGLIGDEPVVLVRLADALAMSRGGQLAGEPTELLERALAKEPENVQGLWLLAMSNNERGEKPEAIRLWKQVLPLLGDDEKSRTEVRSMIAQAESELGIQPGDSVASETAAVEAPQGAALTVSVSLDAAIAEAAAPGDVVFIYAKATSGPPMPLAAVRKTVAELPVTVTLDDSMAMMPAMKLSAFEQVTVGARVSKSGNAISQPGDLIGEITPIAVNTGEPVAVIIAQRVP